MTPVLERVRHLVALAADPGASLEEARTAAVQACRLIRAHGLHVVDEPVPLVDVEDARRCRMCGLPVSRATGRPWHFEVVHEGHCVELAECEFWANERDRMREAERQRERRQARRAR